MTALYIHIPYCKQRCIYCDFYSLATKGSKQDYLEALVKEFEQRKSEVKEPIETLYIGGGTPTVLTKEEITYLFENILKDKTLFDLKEITIEANPENLSYDYLKFLKDHTPINRLSIGIQTFDNQDLKTIGRKHSQEDAVKAVKTAQELGFNNISIDLIYNLPDMDNPKWLNNLRIAKYLNIQHISAYSLTVEENTTLHKLIEKGELTMTGEDQQIEQYDLTAHFLTQNHFEKYETSSFAYIDPTTENTISPYRSKHNTTYWNGTPYIGLGASAHSYNKEERRWNISNIKEYIKNVHENQPYYEIETLTEKDKYNEYIMIGTRVKEGLEIAYIEKNFPPTYNAHFQKEAQKLEARNLLQRTLTHYILTPEGEHIANTVALQLME